MIMAKKLSKPLRKSTTRNRNRASAAQRAASATKQAARGRNGQVAKSSARKPLNGKRPAKKPVVRTQARVAKKPLAKRNAKPVTKVTKPAKLMTKKLAPKASSKPLSKNAKVAPHPEIAPEKTAPTAPSAKPSAGEIAARLSATRQARALAEGT